MQQRKFIKPERHTAFYPRRLVKTGSTRMLAVGKVVPQDWEMVKVSLVKLEGNECIIKLERLI